MRAGRPRSTNPTAGTPGSPSPGGAEAAPYRWAKQPRDNHWENGWYVDDDNTYVVTFDRKRDLVRNPLTKDLPWLKRTTARLIRFDGAYLRFAGVLTIEHYKGGRLIEEVAEGAIWELMYFGHARVVK